MYLAVAVQISRPNDKSSHCYCITRYIVGDASIFIRCGIAMQRYDISKKHFHFKSPDDILIKLASCQAVVIQGFLSGYFYVRKSEFN